MITKVPSVPSEGGLPVTQCVTISLVNNSLSHMSSGLRLYFYVAIQKHHRVKIERGVMLSLFVFSTTVVKVINIKMVRDYVDHQLYCDTT